MAKPELRVTLISPLRYLRDRGYRIERELETLEWWSLTVPAGAERKSRPRCALKAVVQIALAEGWEQKELLPSIRGLPADMDANR